MQPHEWVRRVKLQHLRVVLAVERNSTLVRASDELGLSQSAITKILSEVESELGVPLFVRTSRGTHITPFGTIVAEQARLVFAHLDRAASEIQSMREGHSGRVTIGVMLTGAAAMLPLALAQLQRERSNIRVRIIEGAYDHLVPLLRQGVLDCIVGRLPAQRYRDGLEMETYYQDRIALVVRPDHPVLGRTASLKDLLAWPWILPLPGTALRELVEAAFHDLDLALPQAPCESISVLANRRLIIESDCVCPFPWQTVELDVGAGLLARIETDPVLSLGPVGITRRKDEPLSPAAVYVVNLLERHSGKTATPLRVKREGRPEKAR